MQMDTPKGSGSGSQPKNPIAKCTAMLSLRHFSACRDFARCLPSSERVDQILAVADVLSARDFYSALQIRHADAGDLNLVQRNFAKLEILLDPTSTNKLPFCGEALSRAHEAFHVLSDPERRALYDREFEQRSGDQTATFWTTCPYCWNLYLYEKMYEDCSLLCHSCRKAFHGVPVKPPAKEGEDWQKYYWRHESTPLRYYEVKEKEDKKNVTSEQKTPIVYISDDDDDDEGLGKKGNEGVKDDVRNERCERVAQGNETVVELKDKGKRRMRIKTVAKKRVWNREKSREKCVDTDNDSDLDAE